MDTCAQESLSRPDPARVCLAGARRAALEALAERLEREAGVRITAIENEVESLVSTLSSEAVDLLLVHADFPELTLVTLISRVFAERQGIPVLVFGFSGRAVVASWLFRAGVSGLVEADDGLGRLVSAIGAVARDRAVLPSSLTSAMLRDFRRPGKRGEEIEDEAPGNLLTVREAQVMALVAAGSSNHDVAAHLCISPDTVKRHLQNVFAELGVGSRTEAASVVFALWPGESR